MDWTARLAGYMNWMGGAAARVDHTANTTIHLGRRVYETRPLPAQKYVTLLKEGRLSRFDYTEIDHCCQNFSLVDGWLESEGLQRRGPVGRAEEAGPIERCDPGGHGKNSTERDRLSPSLRRG